MPRRRLVLAAEFPPPAAGMPVQALGLAQRFAGDGWEVGRIRANPVLPGWLARVPVARTLARWGSFLGECRLIGRADAVHVFSCSGLSFLLFTVPPVLLARLWRRPLVVHYHGGAAADFVARWPRLVRWTLRSADRLIVPSGFLREVFAGHGLESEVIDNPVEVSDFVAGQAWRRGPVVLACRNLLPVYDLGTGLRAFARLHRLHPAARMLVAGDGPESASLQALAHDLGIQEAVEFLGNVDNARMPGLFARARVLLNTSLVDNQPVSVLEAFASGVPVVSTDAGGIPWLVEHGISGLLAAPGDDVALGAHLRRVIEDDTLCRQLAAGGRTTVERCTWERVGPRWKALFEDLLAA